MWFQNGDGLIVLSYSYRSAKAQAQLKKIYNDIDIFVEDTGNRSMWLHILKALLPPNTRLASIVTLGGRDAVTKACRLDQTSTGRPKLYIIDGDFDFLLGKKKERLKYFYRIRASNIENLLLTEEAFLSIALEYQPKKTEESLKALIDFPNRYSYLDNSFRLLFVAYGVAYTLQPSLQTTGHPVTKLIKNTRTGPIVEKLKLRNRAVNLYLTLAKNVGIQTVRQIRNSIIARSNILPLAQVVSGKDYLLPLLLLQFKAMCGYGGSNENFKVALARSFVAKSEPWFARRIKNLSP